MRTLFLSRLSLILSATLLSLTLSSALLAQDDCSEAAILAKRGSWKQDPNVGQSSGRDQAVVTRTLDSLGKLFKTAVPEPIGMEAAWYRAMNSDALFPGWPVRYTCNSLYYCWYCNKNLHKLMLGDETGTWAYVFVNHWDWFFGDRPENTALKTTTEGFPIYTMPQKIGTWKGYDLYQSPVHDHGLCVVITRGGAVPWKPVTQDEYLKTVRAFLLEQRKKMTAPPPRTSAAEYQHQIDNSYLKPEEKQKMLTNIRQRQQQDSLSAAGAAGTSGTSGAAGAPNTRTKYVDDQVQKIDDYVRNTPANQLQQQAILSRHSNTLFDGKFYPAQDAAHQLVTVNPDYFNRRLPDYRPQFMILYWRWVSDNPASLNFKKQFEADFPVEKLQAMINQ